MRGEVDLDYDDELAADASQFGLSAQGGAKVADGTKPEGNLVPQTVVILRDMQYALLVAREVYGETNSKHSESFHHWVQDVLEGKVNEAETTSMLVLLYEERNYYALRMHARRRAGDGLYVERFRKRRMAVIAAQMVVRAVLNKLRGRSYGLWVRRCLWRATEAEGDVRGSSLMKGSE